MMIRLRILVFLSLVGFLAAGCDRSPKTSNPKDDQAKAANPSATPTPKPEKLTREQRIKKSQQLLDLRRSDEASDILLPLLIADPNDAEIIFRLAQIKADEGELAEAVGLLSDIPQDHPEAGIPAMGQSADWLMRLEQYDRAEQLYLDIIKRADTAAVAHRQLAYLYNRQGRRHEAAKHIQQLCRLGNIQEDELHALMVLGHAIYTDPNQPTSSKRPYYPIGEAAQARVFFTAGRYRDAVESLDTTVQSNEVKPAIMAFYGLLTVEAQDQERFEWWLTRVNDQTKQFAEYWAAIGAHKLSEQEFEPAVRALAEALNRDPTDAASMRRINQALEALGEKELAEKWIDRYVTQRDITLASNAIGESSPPKLESYNTIYQGLNKLNRPLEAQTWRLFQSFHAKSSQSMVEKINHQRSALFGSADAFPNPTQRLCGLDLERYALPELKIKPSDSITLPSRGDDKITLTEPVFADVANTVGIHHTFRVAEKPQPFQFALYQSLGGGAAALDYDLDGWHDILLAQGGVHPAKGEAVDSNLFYANRQGTFFDHTDFTGLRNHRYSIGVTSGDWNQDGFPDLVVADIGRKLLYLNNGDGTFRQTEFDIDTKLEILTSSVAMGDVNGDHLPDLFSLHYVKDAAMLNRPEIGEDGNVQTVSPASFVPATDQISLNLGDGRMQHVLVSDTEQSKSTGLGVVIADWDGQPGNEIFVGNDVRPNHLWYRNEEESKWFDVAAVKGCAHGHGGTSTASMGIAVADFDRNGFADIHIANFYQEPASLFMNREGNFQDRCVQFGIQQDSSSVLGFGCQPLDYDNDGLIDLAVTNGNIEKAPGEPLEQRPQMFANTGSRFSLVEVADRSNYWQGEYLGRGMMCMDFDHTGQPDLLITHLDKPTALLANSTPTQNHWLSIQLIGVHCERDAVGAKVEISFGAEKRTGWLLGGDGYLCRNEPTIRFGLGKADTVDSLTVTWPDGRIESFENPPIDSRVLITQGESRWFSFSGPNKVVPSD